MTGARIYYAELGAIMQAWVSLPGEPAVMVGQLGEPEADLIARAMRASETRARVRQAEIELHAARPSAQVYRGWLPAADVAWDGAPGEYLYTLRARRQAGKYVIDLALTINTP